MTLTVKLVLKNLKQISLFGILGIIVTLALASYAQPTAFAQMDENKMDGVEIKANFLFNHGEEKIETFKVFKQLSGFMGENNPSFELQGIVDGGHPLLYEEAHQQHHYKSLTRDKRDFDVMVNLTDGAFTDVHFTYTKCDIVNYYVKTSVDVTQKVWWSGMEVIPHVETFVFECNGFDPLHQIDDPPKPTKTTTENETVEGLPDWVKNNAAWWAQGLISDDEYIQGIQFLVEQGIIDV
ncbi:MAG: hypothetical protein ACXADH_17365 [Candidatus Kariarchaeaceae archaeon]|jgi:hypothetical protein